MQFRDETQDRFVLPLGILAILVAVAGLHYSYLLKSVVYYSADHYPGYYIKQLFSWSQRGLSKPLTFWNPYVSMGTSAVFNPVSGSFYPPHFLQTFVSPLVYFRFAGIAHLVIFALGILRLGKKSRVPVAYAIALACLAVTSSFVNVFTVTNYTHLVTLTWGVWLLSELNSCEGRSKAKLLFFWGLLITNGEPFSLLFMGLLLFSAFLQRRDWSGLAFLGFVTLAIGFPVFGPSLIVLPFTTRSGGLDEDFRLAFSLHPARVITLFSPYFFGHPLWKNFSTDWVHNSPYAPRFYFDTLYVSLPLLTLGLTGFVQWIKEKRVGMVSFLTAAILLSFGKWGPLLYLSSLPPLTLLRNPEKLATLCFLFFLFCSMRSPGLTDIRKNYRTNTGIWLCVFLSILLPIFSASERDYWMIPLSIVFAVSLRAYEKKLLSNLLFACCAIAVGLLQNVIAFPPQRLVPISELDKQSEAAVQLLGTISSDSLQRFEVSTGIPDNTHPHRYLTWGSNMAHKRSSLFGYDAVETPFEKMAKETLFGSASQSDPPHPQVISALFQLSNLHRLLVMLDHPLPNLMRAVEENASVFRLESYGSNWGALIPLSTPSPAWWFPRLSVADSNKVSITWPPRPTPDKQLKNGIVVSEPWKPVECAIASEPLPLAESIFTKWNHDTIGLNFTAPCDGWIFISQTLLPGWALQSNGRDVPLIWMNGTFLGFQVSQGIFQGKLSFTPLKSTGQFFISQLLS